MTLIDLTATIAGHSTPHRVEGKALDASDVAIFSVKPVRAMHWRHGHDLLREDNGSAGVEQTAISQLLPKVDADISLVIIGQKETVVLRGHRFFSLGGCAGANLCGGDQPRIEIGSPAQVLQFSLGMVRRHDTDRLFVGPERVGGQEVVELRWVLGRTKLSKGCSTLQLGVV